MKESMMHQTLKSLYDGDKFVIVLIFMLVLFGANKWTNREAGFMLKGLAVTVGFLLIMLFVLSLLMDKVWP